MIVGFVLFIGLMATMFIIYNPLFRQRDCIVSSKIKKRIRGKRPWDS